MNKVILIGRLTADPEMRQTTNGTSVATFAVAVKRPRSKDGATDFITVVAWRQAADFVCRYFGKGSPILVEGQLQSRDYTDKSGSKRRAWEVIADSVSFVPGANGGRNNAEAETDTADAEPPAYDDLPF